MRLGLVKCSHLGALLLRRLNHLVPIPDEITKTEQVTSTASDTGSGVAVAGSRYGGGTKDVSLEVTGTRWRKEEWERTYFASLALSVPK